MGHKKRNAVTKNSSPSMAAPPPPLQPQSDEAYSPPITKSDSSSLSAVKLECERALMALRRGNHNKALRLMKESVSKYDGEQYSAAAAALVHRVQGTVCYKLYSLIDDTNVKQRHLKKAIDSARRAVELSPNSVEFSHFYANLLCHAATEGRDYEEVMCECDRALEIVNPIDPAKESLHEDSKKGTTAEDRIAEVHNELHSLKQKASIASISTWMKTLGTGEEIRIIPFRKAAEDPMGAALVQTRRPNEIKKASKTLEEKRKEIEVQVAAAKLLQQKLETKGKTDEEKSEKGGEVSMGSDKRDRRKHGLRKNGSNTERKDWVRSYWNSMSYGMKRELLKIKVSDMKNYFVSLKDGSASEVLKEALEFGEKTTWRFWMCCRCKEKFVDSESHINHVIKEHLGNLMPKMQAVLPQNVDSKWIQMIHNFSWKPFDISMAVKMLENQQNFRDGDITNDFYMEDDDCFKDAWDSSPEMEILKEDNNHISESNDADKYSSMYNKDCEANHSSIIAYSIDNWPVSEDSERGKLLERIHATFEALIRHKCLATSHLNKVIQLTMEELQSLASGSQLLNCGIDQRPACICFLGASQLRNLLKFLQELSHSCGLGRYPEKTSTIENVSSGAKVSDNKEEIVLSGDASFLYLDDHLLPCEDSNNPHLDGDGTTTSSACVGGENNNLSNNDSLLSWIFGDPLSGEQLQSWLRVKEEKLNQGLEVLQTLDKDFYHLQSLCERKLEHLSYEEAFQAVEDLCLEKSKRMETVIDSENGGYYYVLRQRSKELSGDVNDAILSCNSIELDVISNILKEAEAMHIHQCRYDSLYSSQLCDVETGEVSALRNKESSRQMDSCIEFAIRSLKDRLSEELNKLDARILQNVTAMHRLEIKLDPVSVHDYHAIMLSLVKSYLRAYLEDLAEKDATERSDAAREAFLAELALDSKKSNRGGSDNLKSALEKSKDKKRVKEHKKSKESKGTVANKQLTVFDETAEKSSFEVESDGDLQDSELLLSIDDETLRQQDEELKRKIQLEEEERMLIESLEKQKQIENEAKQKHLAEQQHKKHKQMTEEEASRKLHEATYAEHSVNGALKLLEHQTQINGFTEEESVLAASSNGDELSSNHFSRSGLSNGRTAEGSVLNSDRRTGRRSRRQKNSTTSVDGKYQPKLLEEENNEAVSVKSTSGENGAIMLREPQEEEDYEEKFQAELKLAVRQSLDSYQTSQKGSSVSTLRMQQKRPLETNNLDSSHNEVAAANLNGDDVFGTGLKNDVGEYNCFLNVIIQSLWHLRRFRDEFLRTSTSDHVHVGDPCVVCALYDIFSALNIATTDMRREAIAPTSLRIALSNLYPDSKFFQEAQMNDASEVLAVIFDCLHQAFTSHSSVSDSESVESSCTGSWDCSNGACLVHSHFGMDVFERMNCFSCGLESRHLKYTSFFHNINASALRTMKVMYPECSFSELLNLVEMNHQLACDLEVGGCGKLNYIHHILSSPQHVFTTVLGWQNTCEAAEDIAATLATLSNEMNISIFYRGLDPNNKHSLVSVVCYYGQHYHCFAYSHDHDRWIMYDDKTVKVIGGWNDVLTMCERGHLQPQVLFFEAVN